MMSSLGLGEPMHDDSTTTGMPSMPLSAMVLMTLIITRTLAVLGV